MLIDTFMFYNELDILELRLEVLDKYVDRFVLVESEVTHVGGPKELHFTNNRARFTKWLDKIEHVIVRADESPTDTNPWSREKYQRECITRGIERAGIPNDAHVMVSDVDEIPDMTLIDLDRIPKVCSIHMWMFEYSFKYLFINEPWFGTVITNCELFKHVGPNYLRDNRWKFTPIRFSGWHLSSFGNPTHVCNKMHTFAHAKDGHHANQTPATFEDLINKGKHTDGTTDLIPCPSDVPLPGSPEVRTRLGLV